MAHGSIQVQTNLRIRDTPVTLIAQRSGNKYAAYMHLTDGHLHSHLMLHELDHLADLLRMMGDVVALAEKFQNHNHEIDMMEVSRANGNTEPEMPF